MLLCASVQGLSAATGKRVSGDGDEAEADPDREVLLDYLAHAFFSWIIHCT